MSTKANELIRLDFKGVGLGVFDGPERIYTTLHADLILSIRSVGTELFD